MNFSVYLGLGVPETIGYIGVSLLGIPTNICIPVIIENLKAASDFSFLLSDSKSKSWGHVKDDNRKRKWGISLLVKQLLCTSGIDHPFQVL